MKIKESDCKFEVNTTRKNPHYTRKPDNHFSLQKLAWCLIFFNFLWSEEAKCASKVRFGWLLGSGAEISNFSPPAGQTEQVF